MSDAAPDPAPPGERSRHHRVKQLFLDALDVPRGRRAAFLAEASEGDESIRREVLELFLLHGEDDSLLDNPLDGMAALADAVPIEGGEFGPWRPVRLLGTGGMGVVHLAAHVSDPSPRIALKVLAAGTFSPEIRERFRLEAEILRRLDHPGIARVVDAGEAPGPGGVPRPWIAMEFIDGRTLHEYAAAEGLGLEARVDLLGAVCDAVQHAHSQGIVHRDLKPSNLLVRADGTPVVLDFGVARLTSGDERPTELLTRTGQLVGTPQYMSPEQVQAEPAGIGPASDVYSLGMIAYELFTGRLPYDAASISLHRAIVTILTTDPVPMGQVAPKTRGPLERIVGKALEKRPLERYANAGALAEDLRCFRAHRRVAARRPGLMRRVQRWSSRRRRLVAAMLAAATLLLLFVAWWLGRDHGVPRARVLEAYREAEGASVQATPILYEGERTAARMRQAIDLLSLARAAIVRVPPLRHANLLLRHVEKDLGTAQFLYGELTWDSAPYHAAIQTLAHAATLPADTLPGWREDLQTPGLGYDVLYTPPADLASLYAAAQVGLHRLRGEPGHLGEAYAAAGRTLDENRRRWGPPRDLAKDDAYEAFADPFVYCYNGLAEITTERALFSRSPALAREALQWSDSAYARRLAVHRNWPALGSVLFERGRAFRSLGELTGSRADLDSALTYLEASADFRGASRPWVHAQTEEELALRHLDVARLAGEPSAREAAIMRARTAIQEALAGSAQLAGPASASLVSLEGEILVELGRVTRNPLLLEGAAKRLAESARGLPATTVPRHAALNWVREAMLARARYERAGDDRDLGAAARALDHASTLAEATGDSLVFDRIGRERAVLRSLTAGAR